MCSGIRAIRTMNKEFIVKAEGKANSSEDVLWNESTNRKFWSMFDDYKPSKFSVFGLDLETISK